MAWLRPIRRGLGAVLADLEPFLGLEPRPSPQTLPVHRALLALGHGSLSLPAAATFTRLPLAGADVPLTARASSTWKSHLVLSVPRPSGRAATASSSSAGSRSHVPLHRLRLHEHEAAPLNAELARLARRLASSQPGVDKTNFGGWQVPRHRTRAPPLSARTQPGTASRSAWHFSSGRQSADELFEGSPSACCAKLQAIASGALDEAQLHHVQTGALKAEAAEAEEAAAAAEEEEEEAAASDGAGALSGEALSGEALDLVARRCARLLRVRTSATLAIRDGAPPRPCLAPATLSLSLSLPLPLPLTPLTPCLARCTRLGPPVRR